ncbi:MAG: sugar ABC transporter permease [Verrucomicrobia bacterium]|nr:sugar ABC transporter permease [Verrucomicrobiota bacterium]MBV8274609.1 sugar ABC transporter permease [Verrucomicrobiota bacterium]
MSVHAQPKVTSPQPHAATPPRRSFSFFHALRFRESYCAWIFIAPALIGFLTFYLMPAFRALYISLTDWNLLRVPKFIGPANFSKLWNDPNFWNSMKVTVLYVLYNIPIQTVIGLLLAVLLARLGRSVILRSVILAPYLIANVIAAIIWFWMLDPLLGFGNAVLQWIGIGRIPFFTDQQLALPTIAVVNIWRHMGLTALLFYTGIQAIPRDIYEAARIEGAGAWRSFFGITLPLIRPTMVFVLVTSIIGSFQVFDSIAVTTLGGPNYATRTIVWYIYENGFVNFRMGYASALSCALFVCLAIVTLVQMRILRSGQSELG